MSPQIKFMKQEGIGKARMPWNFVVFASLLGKMCILVDFELVAVIFCIFIPGVLNVDYPASILVRQYERLVFPQVGKAVSSRCCTQERRNA